jgi:hypothetical protein
MKTIDFTQQGGMPLTQELLATMQENYRQLRRIVEGLIEYDPDSDSENNYILFGLQSDTINGADGYEAGAVLFEGRVYSVAKGAGDALVFGESNTSLLYGDGLNKAVITELTAQIVDSATYTGAGVEHDISEFIRLQQISGLKSIVDSIQQNIAVLQQNITALQNKQWRYIPLTIDQSNETHTWVTITKDYIEVVKGYNHPEIEVIVEQKFAAPVAAGIYASFNNYITNNISFFHNGEPAFGSGINLRAKLAWADDTALAFLKIRELPVNP